MRNTLIKNRFLMKGVMMTAVVATLSFSSCKKFTELNPINTLSESTAFDTPANIELVMAGVYNTATVGTYNGTTGRGYPFGAASILQSEMRGEDMINLDQFFAITYESTITAGTANNVNMWSNLYALINQCNVLIEGVTAAAERGTITAAIANQYSAEARFLRALAHHELVVNFCRPFVDGSGSNLGVPYRTVSINTLDMVQPALDLPRGTVAEVYAKILEDLDFAEANSVPLRSTNKITRVTSGAAIALKTRIKQHMADWPGVIAEGAKLGASATAGPYKSPIGNYELTASPETPFSSFKDNTESIFSIENGASSSGGTNGALPNMLLPAKNAVNTAVGRNLVATNPNLYVASFWVTGDTRRTLLQIQQTTAGANYFFNFKYRDPLTSSDYAPIIRYAEVLLNVAEAYSRTVALSPNALSLLNAVRNRAVPVAEQFTIASFANQNALTQAILNERRIEFAGEGRRWGDITRLSKDPNFAVAGGGIPAKVTKSNLSGDGSNYNLTTRPVTATSKAAIPYSDIHYIWPIPNDELNANPSMVKNPGY